MGIGTRIRELRKRAGMTQLELSERVGVHETSIRRWEKEKDSGPDTAMIMKLAEALGVTAEALLADTERETSPEGEKSLVYERNGERMELPPTEESYAIFKEIARMIAGREIGHSSAVAMA